MASFDELVDDQLQQHRDLLLRMNYSKAAAEVEETQLYLRTRSTQVIDAGTVRHQYGLASSGGGPTSPACGGEPPSDCLRTN